MAENKYAVLAIHLKKCEHLQKDLMKVDRFSSDKKIQEIFCEEHGFDNSSNFDVKVTSSLGCVSNKLTVGEIQSLDIKKSPLNA